MADETAQQAPAPRVGREGSRWFNQRPTSEEVADWFKDIPLHDELEKDRDRYIGGIVLIEGTIKEKEVRGFNEATGAPIITEGRVEHLTYTPYPKVETRVQYFHDLMGKHEDWLGVIEPVGGGEGGLPPGYFARVVPHANRQGQAVQTRFLCCTMKVTVYERGDFTERVITHRNGTTEVVRTGKTIIDGAPATKMVPLLLYVDKPDPNSMMKAETGAVGRALGMAGMLVVPGAGVATAEDMSEAHALETAPPASEAPGAEQARLPEIEAQSPQAGAEQGDLDPAAEEKALREQGAAAIAALRTEFPEVFAGPFKEWLQSRNIESLNDQTGPALKGLVRKAEKTLDEARKAPKVETPPPAPEEPGEAPGEATAELPVEEPPAEPETPAE